MQSTYRRPTLTSFFYGFAVACIPLSIVTGLYVWSQIRILGGWTPTAFAITLIASSIISVSFYLALGYAIEKLAQIEWNTRPENRAIAPAAGPQGWTAGRQFFVVTSGRTQGPLSSAQMLDLYRDGKLTKSTQILVEENGYRRAVTDWSEFGL